MIIILNKLLSVRSIKNRDNILFYLYLFILWCSSFLYIDPVPGLYNFPSIWRTSKMSHKVGLWSTNSLNIFLFFHCHYHSSINPTQWVLNFCVLYFSVLKFPFVSFVCIFYCFADTFYLSIYFKSVDPYFLEHLFIYLFIW